jgi:hypothetical protein
VLTGGLRTIPFASAGWFREMTDGAASVPSAATLPDDGPSGERCLPAARPAESCWSPRGVSLVGAELPLTADAAVVSG